MKHATAPALFTRTMLIALLKTVLPGWRGTKYPRERWRKRGCRLPADAERDINYRAKRNGIIYHSFHQSWWGIWDLWRTEWMIVHRWQRLKGSTDSAVSWVLQRCGGPSMLPGFNVTMDGFHSFSTGWEKANTRALRSGASHAYVCNLTLTTLTVLD